MSGPSVRTWYPGVATRLQHLDRTGARSMSQLIPSLATLVAAFSDCFHPQVFQTFQALLAGWITCQGPRTISEAWLATGLAAKRHHDTAYAVFHSAVREWDDLGIVLATLILTHLVPGGGSSGWPSMIPSATSGEPR